MDLDQITNEMNCNGQKVLILNRKKNEIQNKFEIRDTVF